MGSNERRSIIEPVAQWSSVSKHYGKIAAVEDVSLALHPGEATALVGHNGAGKTTLAFVTITGEPVPDLNARFGAPHPIQKRQD